MISRSINLPKNRHAVYVLISKGKPVYVGKTSNLFLRLHEHRNKEFDSVEILWMPKSKLKAAELFHIQKRYAGIEFKSQTSYSLHQAQAQIISIPTNKP